jgi:hypothetical protein
MSNLTICGGLLIYPFAGKTSEFDLNGKIINQTSLYVGYSGTGTANFYTPNGSGIIISYYSGIHVGYPGYQQASVMFGTPNSNYNMTLLPAGTNFDWNIGMYAGNGTWNLPATGHVTMPTLPQLNIKNGALIGGGSAAIVIAIGLAMVTLAKFFAGAGLAFKALVGDEPDFVTAGLWVGAALIIVAM